MAIMLTTYITEIVIIWFYDFFPRAFWLPFLEPFLILGKGILLIWIQYDISEIFNTILAIPALTRFSRHNVCISVKLPLPCTEFRCWKNATGYFEGPWSKLQPYERRFSFPFRQIWVILKICLADVILKAKVTSFPSQGGSCYQIKIEGNNVSDGPPPLFTTRSPVKIKS